MSKADRGRAAILDLLGDGEWHPGRDVVGALGKLGVGEREARRLRDDLGVEYERRGRPPVSYWRLPAGRCEPTALVDDRDALGLRLAPRIDRQSDGGLVTTAAAHAALVRLLHAATAAERAGDELALADVLEETAAALVAWADGLRATAAPIRAKRLSPTERVVTVAGSR